MATSPDADESKLPIILVCKQFLLLLSLMGNGCQILLSERLCHHQTWAEVSCVERLRCSYIMRLTFWTPHTSCIDCHWSFWKIYVDSQIPNLWINHGVLHPALLLLCAIHMNHSAIQELLISGSSIIRTAPHLFLTEVPLYAFNIFSVWRLISARNHEPETMNTLFFFNKVFMVSQI